MAGIDEIRQIGEQFDRDKVAVTERRSLDNLRTKFLSRKSGLLTLQLQALRQLPKEERSEFGKRANQLKQRI